MSARSAARIPYVGRHALGVARQDCRPKNIIIHCNCAQADEKLASEQAAALEKGIDGAWCKRIEQGDPFEKLLQKDKVGHLQLWSTVGDPHA